jgi:hypothetical protein
MPNFMKICLQVLELLHADGQTDIVNGVFLQPMAAKSFDIWRSQSPLWRCFRICPIIINWRDFDRNTDGTYFFCNLWLRKHLTFWRSQSPLWRRFRICPIIINWRDFDRNTDGTFFIEIYYKNQINDIGTHSRVLLYASRTKRANFLCCTWHVSVLIGYTSNKWQLLHDENCFTAWLHISVSSSTLLFADLKIWHDMTCTSYLHTPFQLHRLLLLHVMGIGSLTLWSPVVTICTTWFKINNPAFLWGLYGSHCQCIYRLFP